MGNYASVITDKIRQINRRHTKRITLSGKATPVAGLFITGLGGQYPEHIYTAADFEHVVKSLCAGHLETPGYEFPPFCMISVYRLNSDEAYKDFSESTNEAVSTSAQVSTQ
jgi:hypothetical protein